jgi:hypothetical protein
MLKTLTALKVKVGDKVQYVSPDSGKPGAVRTILCVGKDGGVRSAERPNGFLAHDDPQWRMVERANGNGDLENAKELFSQINTLVEQAGYAGVVDIRILGNGGVMTSWSGAVIEIKQNWVG